MGVPWDGLGAYLDFTKPATAAWWREQATRALLDVGIDATWNDNVQVRDHLAVSR